MKNPTFDPIAKPGVLAKYFRGNPDQVGATLEAAARRKLYQKSLLDYVLDDAHRLEKRLDAADRLAADDAHPSLEPEASIHMPSAGAEDDAAFLGLDRAALQPRSRTHARLGRWVRRPRAA